MVEFDFDEWFNRIMDIMAYNFYNHVREQGFKPPNRATTFPITNPKCDWDWVKEPSNDR